MMASTDARANIRTIRQAGDRLLVYFGGGAWLAPVTTRFQKGDRVRCAFAGEVILVNDRPEAVREVWTASGWRS